MCLFFYQLFPPFGNANIVGRPFKTNSLTQKKSTYLCKSLKMNTINFGAGAPKRTPPTYAYAYTKELCCRAPPT